MLDYLRTLTPPEYLAKSHGGPKFHEIGAGWVETFKQYAVLQPHHDVLDVGCGPGRMAIALGQYLTTGSYHGFDIRPQEIDWCKENIEPAWSNARFQLADVQNSHYNPKGKIAPEDFRFPFSDQSFDFVFMTSVLTHMRTAGAALYLRETARVLRQGGRCLITFFLIAPHVKRVIAKGGSRFRFRKPWPWSRFYTTRLDDPDSAVGFDEKVVTKLYKRAGLTIVEPIYHGTWSGAYTDATRHGQDFIVATPSFSGVGEPEHINRLGSPVHPA